MSCWAVIRRNEDDDDGLGENREAGGTSRRWRLLRTVTVQCKRTQGNETNAGGRKKTWHSVPACHA